MSTVRNNAALSILITTVGMWKGFSAARPWLVSLISAAIAYLYLPTGWYVPIGAICGIASAFLFIQEDEL
jgi:predicted branched-subunit amino acid permease